MSDGGAEGKPALARRILCLGGGIVQGWKTDARPLKRSMRRADRGESPPDASSSTPTGQVGTMGPKWKLPAPCGTGNPFQYSHSLTVTNTPYDAPALGFDRDRQHSQSLQPDTAMGAQPGKFACLPRQCCLSARSTKKRPGAVTVRVETWPHSCERKPEPRRQIGRRWNRDGPDPTEICSR